MRKGKWILWFLVVLMVGCASTSQKEMEREMRESNYRLKYKLGISYIQSGRFKDALLELLEAQKLNPQSKEVYNALGISYLGLGELDKAEASLKKAISLDPNYSEAHANLANVYINRGEWQKAVDECTRALKNPMYLTPEVAYNNRGYAYLMMGKEKEALLDFYKALRYNPKFPKAYENLISYYLSKDDTVRARGILEDALASGLESPGIIYFRALFAHMDGFEEKACTFFKQVVKDYPLTLWAKKARAYLDILGNSCEKGAPVSR